MNGAIIGTTLPVAPIGKLRAMRTCAGTSRFRVADLDTYVEALSFEEKRAAA